MFAVRFQGGFANQIFQYALLLKLKELFPTAKVLADLSHYKTCKDHGGFKLNRFVRLKQYRGHKKNNFETITETNCHFENLDVSKDYYFNGYWQEEKFSPKDIQKIKSIFNIDNLNSRNKAILKSIIDTNSISVHVRRGDYVNNFMHGNIANQCYLQNSIDYAKKAVVNPHFFVFSDDIEWAQNSLNFFDSNVTFVSGNSNKVEQDIILMSSCKHNIISNSSFSWWAQFLNSNPEKIVITPEYWFNQETEATKDLFVSDSIKIPNTPTVEDVSLQPFFSILIPVYNTSKTLRRTLASVLNQTFVDIEVIIVDDGSTDNSFEILKTYEARDKRVKIIKHEKNSGLLAARYTAMKEAAGKYVLFIDSDDWLELDACKILYNELKKNPVDMLEFGYIREPIGYKQPILQETGSRLNALFYKRYPVTIWNKVYSISIIKNVIDSFTPFYLTFAEDAFFTVIIAYFIDKMAARIAYLHTYLFHYSLSTGISTQNDYDLKKLERLTTDLKIMQEHLIDFIEKNIPDYKNPCCSFIKDRGEFISYLAMKNSNPGIRFRSLLIIDEIMGTSFFDDQLIDYDKKLTQYEMLLNLNFWGKCIFVMKYIIKKVLRKIKTFITLFNIIRL